MRAQCLYKYGLDHDTDGEPDLLAEPTRYILFDIVHGYHHHTLEEHEILSIPYIPEDCDEQELKESVEDYYHFYFTNEPEKLTSALNRLF
jgi:hypothetical protein